MADLKLWSRDEITRMRHEVDRLFDNLCMDFDLPVMFCRMAGDLDLREEGDTLVVRLELGNMDPDDVSVIVHNRRLIITAKTETDDGTHRQKHSFKKELTMPCNVESDQVLAEFTDGALEVRLSKCPR